MKLLECKNLSLGYGTTLIQQNLNISIEQGGYVFILGENGSGKSTLVKTMLGFIKPFSGSIEYSPQWNKKGLGYLPQTSEIQKTFPATVKEIVLSGCQADLGLFPFYKKNITRRRSTILIWLVCRITFITALRSFLAASSSECFLRVPCVPQALFWCAGVYAVS